MEGQASEVECVGRESKRLVVVLLCVATAIYIASSVGFALTKRPWCDEAWFANPGYNLMTRGVMSTSVLADCGPPGGIWQGMAQHTYWQPPLSFLAQCAWYRLFGFSVFSGRGLSVFFGLMLIASAFVLLRGLTRSSTIAALACLGVAIEPVFARNAADVRMDAMCAALGYAGLAAYVTLRQKRLTVAVLVANSFVAASALTHPNGILAFGALAALVLYLDRARLTGKHVAVAFVPYMLGFAAWGMYIAQDTKSFAAQFLGNLTSRTGGLTNTLQFWNAIKNQIVENYFANWGLGQGGASVQRLKAIVLLTYAVGIAGIFLARDLRRHTGYRAVAFLTVLYFVLMALAVRKTLYNYSIHIVPLLVANAVIFAWWVWQRRRVPRLLTSAYVGALILLQIGSAAYSIQSNQYRNLYAPAMAAARAAWDQHGVVVGSAELGFEFGFDANIKDDIYLGLYSGLHPAVIYWNDSYEAFYARCAEDEPRVHDHIGKVLAQFRQVYANTFYRVYARR